jgi:hypothetical protein
MIRTYDFGSAKDKSDIEWPRLEDITSFAKPCGYEITHDWNKHVTIKKINLYDKTNLTLIIEHEESQHTPSGGGQYHYYYDESCCCTGNSTPYGSLFDTNTTIKDQSIMKLKKKYLDLLAIKMEEKL